MTKFALLFLSIVCVTQTAAVDLNTANSCQTPEQSAYQGPLAIVLKKNNLRTLITGPSAIERLLESKKGSNITQSNIPVMPPSFNFPEAVLLSSIPAACYWLADAAIRAYIVHYHNTLSREERW
jgi:hypothetical protein